MTNENNDRQKKEMFQLVRQVGIMTTIPMILVSGPIVGYLVGLWIDQKFGVDPYGKIVLMVLGFMASARETYRMIQDVIKRQNRP